jgi:hypothetical protein
MQALFRTVDHRMESFVALFGRLPAGAQRLQDFECREHVASWLRRLLGKGIAGNYVIAYVRGDEWWTFCFDRQTSPADLPDTDEPWLIEAYDSSGQSWSDIFHYVSDSGRWYRPRPSERLDRRPTSAPQPS